MTNDANPSNTAGRASVTARRSSKVRYEASRDQRAARRPAGQATGLPKPETLVSAKAQRRVLYGPDVGGPKALFELQFTTSVGREFLQYVSGSDLLRPDRVITQVLDECGLFSADLASLRRDVEQCVITHVPEVTRTAVTGWRGVGNQRAFITPAGAFGPGSAHHEFDRQGDHISISGEVGAQRGTLKGWRKSVGRYLEMSSAGRVLLGAAFAAPLIKSAGLGDSWIFLLAGKSTTGKSTLLNGVSSFQGSGTPVSPRTSDRRFNELAAKNNQLLFVVGDLSQLNRADRRRVLHWLVMDATAGQPRSVSRAVKDKLPDLPFVTIAALSAEQTAAEIAEGAGVQQLVGESVRCFDLMPGAEGYFDVRPKGKKFRPETITQRINDGALQQYGSGLRAWIEWLATKDEDWLETRVRGLIDEFVTKLDSRGSLTGLERRAARKFGLVYAGLVLGGEAKITRISPKRAFKSVRACFLRAFASAGVASPDVALAALRKALSAPDALLRTCQGGAAVKAAVRRNPNWLAFDTTEKGRRMIGLYPPAVRKAIGAEVARAAFAKLAEDGALRMDRGGDRWLKKIPGGGKVRLLALKPDWLDRG